MLINTRLVFLVYINTMDQAFLPESHSEAHFEDVELIFLGTGTSSSVPHIACLTAPPGEKPCHTCRSTLTIGGKKNIRRNTSAAIRMTARDGQKVYVSGL
jgi:hypothetical protein